MHVMERHGLRMVWKACSTSASCFDPQRLAKVVPAPTKIAQRPAPRKGIASQTSVVKPHDGEPIAGGLSGHTSGAAAFVLRLNIPHDHTASVGDQPRIRGGFWYFEVIFCG